MGFILSRRSMKNLEGVHPDLVRVVKRALELTSVDFTVIEGVRTAERQKVLFTAGATKTMNSRHLTGHAVDLAAWVKGGIRWDWSLYEKIALAMKAAAEELGIKLTWGGDWKSFKDGPHFELAWKEYPK
jgi:peptidoglycan L-alanyl-D-glutamate endopeptidase CwlK